MTESVLEDGLVTLELEGEPVELSATIEAARKLSKQGGLRVMMDRIGNMDLDAYVAVISAGTGDRNLTSLEERVHHSGVMNLMVPLIEYLSILANGGRRQAEKKSAARSKAKA